MTAIKGVDYSHHAFTGAQLKAAGIVFAARYIQNFPGSSLDKEMKATELASLSAAGVRVVANWEWSANPPNDRATGKDHATKAKARLALLHVPGWAPVYYSIDTGLSANTRNAYAQGWRDVYPADQLGVYTCGALFRQLKADGYVKYAWQSMSKSFPGNSNPDGTWNHSGADVIQTGNGTLLGHSLDWDTAVVEDYGGFLMGEADPMALTQADANLVVKTLVADKNFQYLIWRMDAVAHLRDVFGAGAPTALAGTPVPLTVQLKAIASGVSHIPTTAVPAAPADVAAIAKAVNDDAAKRLES